IKERDSLSQKFTAAEAAKAAAEAEKSSEVARVKKSYEDLTAGLKSEISAGEIKITQLQGKLTVNLVDRILFDSGKAEVKDDGRTVLDKVGGILVTLKGKDIRIEGHTDDRPITGELLAKYPSNWELSTARATAVARYLQDRAKVDPTSLVATGYGKFRPVASNDTPESRALNRRIEIVLVPRD
ncbi:MAG: flagellar motor protein MotB, partial [Elusimicrobiota bacterium]